MKKIFPVVALAGMLALPSCVKGQFEVRIDSKAKIYLQCFPGPSDTTVIQVCRSIPVSATDRGPAFLPEIDFRVNGSPVSVQEAPGGCGTVPPGCRFVACPLAGGDRVEFRASASGVEKAVSASTVIPGPFPACSHSFDGRTLTLRFRDDPATEDAYGVIVYMPDGACRPEAEAGGTGTFPRNEPLDVPFNGWACGGSGPVVRVWPDERFPGEEVELSMRVETLRTGRYKLLLYRFTKDFYRYARAQDNLDGNDLSAWGLAPAHHAFTNVSDGLGIFAACSVTETGWTAVERDATI